MESSEKQQGDLKEMERRKFTKWRCHKNQLKNENYKCQIAQGNLKEMERRLART
jgi:hypothetical protein